jgi:hypothetical protein
MARNKQTFGDRMAALRNARQERYAQEIAKGKSQTEAYEAAGYRPSRSNASALRANKNVSDRVATLLAAAALKTEMTVASLTERLVSIADKGEALADAPGLSVARQAVMDAAKLNGMVIDQSKVEGRFADVTDEPVDHDEAVAEFVEALKGDGIDVN